jgi:hypothetical protein
MTSFQIRAARRYSRKAGTLKFNIDRDDVILRQNGNGTLTGTARYIWYNGKRYTRQGLACHLINEVIRKGTRACTRTVSPRKAAGSRRTKRIARARR